MSKHRDEIILFCTIQFIHIVFVSLDFATNNMCVHLFFKANITVYSETTKGLFFFLVNLSIDLQRDVQKSIGEIRRSSLEERLDSSMTNDSLTTGIRNGAFKSSTNRKFSTEFNLVDTKTNKTILYHR